MSRIIDRSRAINAIFGRRSKRAAQSHAASVEVARHVVAGDDRHRAVAGLFAATIEHEFERCVYEQGYRSANDGSKLKGKTIAIQVQKYASAWYP